MLAPLPDGAALVAAIPSAAGHYTRVGEHLGVMVQAADRTVVVVQDVAG